MILHMSIESWLIKIKIALLSTSFTPFSDRYHDYLTKDKNTFVELETAKEKENSRNIFYATKIMTASIIE